MKILVTGGKGMVGKHLQEILPEAIYVGSKDYDLRDWLDVENLFETFKPTHVIHLAAKLIIAEGEKYPKKYYKSNILGRKSLLSACEGTLVKNIIFSSKAAVQKDGQHIVNENSLVKPKSVYGKTKLKGEKLIKSFCKLNKVNYGILRYFNIAGSSSSGKIGLLNKSDHLFKNFSREIIKKNPVLKIYGKDYNTKDGSCIRDYIHVSDIGDIHYKVLEKINKLGKSYILNCGYNRGISVLQVANEFKKQSNKKVKISFTKKRKGDLVKIISSNRKLIKLINWRPKFNNLNFIVKSCLKWEYKQNKKQQYSIYDQKKI